MNEIRELYFVVQDEEDDEAIACYPLDKTPFIAFDKEGSEVIMQHARQCNEVWHKNLRLARFIRDETVTEVIQ